MERKGFTCDGGCGATLVIAPHESLATFGWWTTYTGDGSPTVHACSFDCLLSVLHRRAERVLPEGTKP